MDYIIKKISDFFIKDDKATNIGFVLQKSDNKQLVLLKRDDKFWKTEWLDSSIVIIKPDIDIKNIFSPNHL